MAKLREDSLPVGFRFRPTDEELVIHYLKGKITGKVPKIEVIAELDVCKFEPWDLPGKSIIKNDDPEWFFFSSRNRKYTNGKRSNRATETGYWKATGKDRKIKSSSPGFEQIGTKKTLVFHRGRAPKGERTIWVIHEYQANKKALEDTNGSQDAFVLIRLFRKPENRTETKNLNIESQSCDIVDPSGLSPTTSKSFPEGNLPTDIEDPTSKNGTLDVDMAEGPQLLPAVTDSEEIEKWLSELVENETPHLPIENDTICSSNNMGDPEEDALGSSFDQAFRSLDSNAAVLYSNSIFQFDDCYRATNSGPPCEANAEQEDSSEDYLQYLNLSDDEHPEQLTLNSIEAVGDIGIQRRSHSQQVMTDFNTYSLQGNAPRRIRLQINMIQSCGSDSEDHEDVKETTEDRGRIIEAIDDSKHDRFPEQGVLTPPVDQKCTSITRARRPLKGKAALHQEDCGEIALPNQSVKEASSPNTGGQRDIEKPGQNSRSGSKPKLSKNSVDMVLSSQPAASRLKTRSTVILCLTLIIILVISVTAIWRSFIL